MIEFVPTPKGMVSCPFCGSKTGVTITRTVVGAHEGTTIVCHICTAKLVTTVSLEQTLSVWACRNKEERKKAVEKEHLPTGLIRKKIL